MQSLGTDSNRQHCECRVSKAWLKLKALMCKANLRLQPESFLSLQPRLMVTSNHGNALSKSEPRTPRHWHSYQKTWLPHIRLAGHVETKQLHFLLRQPPTPRHIIFWKVRSTAPETLQVTAILFSQAQGKLMKVNVKANSSIEKLRFELSEDGGHFVRTLFI